jgi:hypothetical protein
VHVLLELNAYGRCPMHLSSAQALHAIELRTPLHVFLPGTWFARGSAAAAAQQAGAERARAGSPVMASPQAGKQRRDAPLKCLELEDLDIAVR